MAIATKEKVTVLKWRDDLYRGRGKRPSAEDVILLIKVSESTLPYDRGGKLALYAESGVPEYWVVNINEQVIEVYTDLAEGTYGSVRVAQKGETLPLPVGFHVNIAVSDVLG